MSRQWKRAIKLTVGVQSGSPDALDFSDFRIRFYVRQAMNNIPGSAEIYVYNVSPSTAGVFRGEGQAIELQAGYEGAMDVIFRGQVRQFLRGRESQTDTYLGILAQVADQAHNYSCVNTTLAAGSTPTDQRNALMQAYQPFGVTAGQMDALPGNQLPRGKVMYGMTRDYMGELAANHGLQLGYDNGQVVMLSPSVSPDEEAVVLNSQTGMIGMPILTINGLSITCLLNPRITHRGQQIKINNNDVQMPLKDLTYGADARNYQLSDAAKGADGYWRTVSVEHMGDTRGEIWQTSMMCTGINATATPTSGAAINAVG